MNKWRKAGTSILGLVILLITISPNSAWGVAAFGPKDYVRSNGAPKMITDNFTATPGTTCNLEIYNGGLEDASTERISASVIYLNGDLVAGPSDFNQQVSYIEKPVTLQANNILKVEVRSKPGGKITIIVCGDVDTTPPVVQISSPANGSILNSQPITISGTIDDDTATVSVNGVTATVSAGTFTATGITLTEGANSITATATDPAGNEGMDSVNITLDTTAPVVAISDPADNFLTSQSTITVTGTIDDDTATVSVNGVTATVSAGTFTATGITLTEGANTITVTATDPAGNQGSASISGTLDTTAPVVAISDPADNFLTSQSTITVSGTVNDDTATVSVNGVAATVSAGTFTATGVALTEGANAITATATDPAGNAGTASVSGTLDTTAPVVAITDPVDNFLTSQASITVTGTIDDDTASVSVNGIAATVSAGSFTAVGITLTEGANTITATATDPAGNQGSASISGTLDTTAPVVAISDPADNFLTSQSPITVTGTIDDDTASVSVNGIAATVSAGSFTAVGITLTEGANTITATATDPAGNQGSASISGTLDTTAPVVVISNPADNFLTSQSTITVTGTIDDDTATVSVNGVTATVSAGTFTATGITLTEGANTITVTATDPAGNQGSASISGTLDTTAPVVAISDPADNFLTSQSPITVTGTIDDDTASVSVNGIAATVSAGSFTAVGITLTEGANTITATATDPAGNQGSASVSGTLDTTAPVVAITDPVDNFLTSQASITVTGTIDDDTAGVSVNGITATVSAGTFTAAGVTLTEGANTITATATDPAGNQGSASISGTLDTTAPVVAISDPADNFLTSQSTITVSGTVNDDTATVSVNGVAATVSAGTFTAVGITLTEGANTITATATDPAGNIGSASISGTLDTTQTPIITETSGFLDGIVYDSTTDLPLEGARVTVKDVYGEVFTDVEGKFSFPSPDAGTYYLDITKDGHTYAQRTVTVVSTRDVAVDPVYLKPSDTQTALITPENGGTLVDSTGNIEMVFEPGTVDVPVMVSATWYEKSRELPGPLPENSHFTWAFEAQPEGLTFNKPVKLRLVNTYGFEPGTTIPVGVYNRETQEWEHYGMGAIDTIGAYAEFNISSLRAMDLNLAFLLRATAIAVPPMITLQTEALPSPAAGHLTLQHTLPKVQSLGRSVGPHVVYNSNTVSPTALLGVEAYVPRSGDPGWPVGAEIPNTMGFLASVEGVKKKVRFHGANGYTRQAYMFDGYNGRGERLTTGSYPIRIAVSNDYIPEFAETDRFNGLPIRLLGRFALQTEPFSMTQENNERIVINDQLASPFGAGWGIAGLKRLYFDPDDAITIVDGNGSGTYFTYLRTEPDNTRIYSSFEIDFSTLVGNADGTYTRTMKNGVKHNFDSTGLLTSKTDRNGNAIEYNYDTNRRLISITYPIGQVFQLAYDSNGYLASITCPAGRTTSFNVDASGKLISITDPDGAVTQFGYNTDNLLVSTTDAGNRTTQYQYDNYKRLKKTIPPSGAETNYNPGASQGLINELSPDVGSLSAPAPAIDAENIGNYYTDALGSTSFVKTYRFGGALKITDPLNQTTSIERNCACGAPTKITYPNGSVVNLSYDDKANLLSQTSEADGATTTYTYENTYNQITSVTDPLGNLTQMYYDANGNLTQIQDAQNNITELTYNSHGQPTGITNANNETTTFSYDLANGYLTSSTDALGRTTSYAYDIAGNLLSVTDDQGNVVASYTYDTMNRLISVTDAAGGITQYTYDVDGTLTSITDAKNQTTQFEYNLQRQLERSIDPLGNIRSYTYDDNGNLTISTNPDGQNVDFVYDPANRMVQTLLPDGGPIIYVYDSMNNLTDTFRPVNDVMMTYDQLGRLTSSDSRLYLQDDRTDIIRFTRDFSIGEGDYGFENRDIVVDGVTLEISRKQATFNTIQVINNGKVTIPAESSLELTAGSIIIEAGSSIDVTGSGYAPRYTLGNTTTGASSVRAGGSYGGRGGKGNSAGYGVGTSNQVYGDYRDPAELGSASPKAAGGGLLRIVANSIILEGDIRADGDFATYSGGSGGGIRLDVGTLSGAGAISANGGTPEYLIGGGGGGRIAIYYTDKSGYSGSIEAHGGASNDTPGGAGTIYMKASTQLYGDLIADNNGQELNDYLTPLRSIGAGVSDSIIYSPSINQSILTDTTAAWAIPDVDTGVLGLVGLELNPNTIQSQSYTVVDNTATTIIVDGDITSVATSGDSYIGEYTFDNLHIRGGATVSTDDDIYVLGIIEVNNATLSAHALKLLDSNQLQATNGTVLVVDPLFDEHATVTLDGDTLTVDHISGMDTLQLNNGAVLRAFSTTPMDIIVNTINIEAGSSIDLTGKGYAPGYMLGNTTTGASNVWAGGSYGGRGGNGGSNGYGIGTANQVYGDYRDPAELGSGSPKAAGGGLLRIVANSLILEGDIRADGEAATYAGGSGGGIRLNVGTLSGAGAITANGGTPTNLKGGGGGGRIAIYYTDKSGYSGSIEAYGGDSYNTPGGAGTIYLKDATQTYGDLIVDNIGREFDDYLTPLRAVGAGISDSIIYSPSTGQSILSNASATWPLPDADTGALGLIGLQLNPNIIQSQSYTVVDNMLTTIIVDGNITSVAASGDSYIGEYTFDNLYVRNKAKVSTDDDIYVMGTIEVNNATLSAHALKFNDSNQLQTTNANIEVSEPLFEGHSTVTLDGDTLTLTYLNVIDNLELINGANLTLGGNTINVTNTLQLSNSSTLTVPQLVPLDITVGSLSVDATSTIDVSGKGYGPYRTLGDTSTGASLKHSGGGYGGKGGLQNGIDRANEVYGDYRNPAELGSGGGSQSGCSGGGLVRIIADSLILDGVIKADGDTRGAPYYTAGGGSGGGIRLDVGSLSGTGSISAVGGDRTGSSSYGSGGGGRIAVYYTDMSGFSGSISANGGYHSEPQVSSPLHKGGAGTIYLKSSAQTYGDLIVDNNGYETYEDSTPLRFVGAGVSDSIIYSPSINQSILTDTTVSWPVPNATTGALGLIGLELNPNTIQSQSYTVVDNTATTIIIDGNITSVATSGDAYVGEYTFDNLYVRGMAEVSTADDIYVLGIIEIDNAGLKTHELNLTDSNQLQATNADIIVTEPLFEGHATVSLDGDTFSVNSITGMDTLQLVNNASITVPQLVPLEITAGSLSIDSTSAIDVSGKGYEKYRTLGDTSTGASVGRSGGSYGGMGGQNVAYNVNDIYGDYRNPAELGSGGGNLCGTCPGGGLVRIVADSLILDGTIRADGVAANGGGSGGGIRLDVGTLSGVGSISATGGDNAGSSSYASGGGGRIALYYTDMSGFTGGINANGGYHAGSQSYASQKGGAGTVYLKASAQVYGDLTIDNNNYETFEYSTPLRAIGAGVSDNIIYSPTSGQSILSNASATWPIPDAVTGTLGLIGLELNPNTIYTQTFTVVDNTATTITVDGNITSVAASGDSYIGEYRFNGLSVINGAQVSTDDNVYFDTLDTTGGTLNANNVYQTGMLDQKLDPLMMLAQELSTEADKSALYKQARRRHGPSLSKPQISISNLEKMSIPNTYANGFTLEHISSILTADISPLDAVDKQIELGASPLYYVKGAHHASAPRAQATPVLLAMAEEAVATDANIGVQEEKQPVAANLDPVYTYDLNGNRISMTDPIGTTTYAYDELNRLTSITNPYNEVTSYTYDILGRRTGRTLPNGITTAAAYDPAGQLLSLVHRLTNTTIASFGYSYDYKGNRTQMTELAGTHDYIYDQLNQLISATHPQPINPTEGFSYDLVGNRIGSAYTYNSGNQLLEDADYIYSYNKDGNTISKTSKSSGEYTKFSYNAIRELRDIKRYASSLDTTPIMSVRYYYDGSKRRIAKKVNGALTRYIYDVVDVILELDGTGNQLAYYTHDQAIDKLISMKRGGSTYYYITDGLGSVVKMVDVSGNVVNSYLYDSFGNMLEKTEGVSNPYTYTARKYDAESGLYYYRYRYYNSASGRFINEDPFGFRSGVNFYTYVNNNPLRYTDPFGLDWISIAKGLTIVGEAATWTGTPYKWGGEKKQKGADCSGAVYGIYQQVGLLYMRLSTAEFRDEPPGNFRKLPNNMPLQAGDVGLYGGHMLIYDPDAPSRAAEHGVKYNTNVVVDSWSAFYEGKDFGPALHTGFKKFIAWYRWYEKDVDPTENRPIP